MTKPKKIKLTAREKRIAITAVLIGQEKSNCLDLSDPRWIYYECARAAMKGAKK